MSHTEDLVLRYVDAINSLKSLLHELTCHYGVNPKQQYIGLFKLIPFYSLYYIIWKLGSLM